MVQGDISDLASVQRAMQSVNAVFISMHTLSPQRSSDARMRFMDLEKNELQNVSSADAANEWLRERWHSEQLLLRSGLSALNMGGDHPKMRTITLLLRTCFRPSRSLQILKCFLRCT